MEIYIHFEFHRHNYGTLCDLGFVPMLLTGLLAVVRGPVLSSDLIPSWELPPPSHANCLPA